MLLFTRFSSHVKYSLQSCWQVDILKLFKSFMSLKYNFICHDSVLKQICFANSTYLRESYTGVKLVLLVMQIA